MAWTQVASDNPFLPGSAYWIDENGNTSMTDPNAGPSANDQQLAMQYIRANGGTPFLQSDVNLQQYFNPATGNFNNGTQQFYNAGNGVGGWVDPGNPAFIAPPHHNDGFFQKDAYDPRAMISEMPGLPLLLAPLAAFAAGGAEGVGAGTMSAVPAESAATVPGVADYAASGGAAGTAAGTTAGASGTATMTGNTANDTLATSETGNMAADPYGTGVDMYGNPTGQYAQYGSPSASYADQTGGYALNSSGGLDSSSTNWLGLGKQGLDFLQQYKGLIGAGLGALVGSAGGAKPAGTTTTTTSGDPAIMPYIQGNLAGAYRTLQNINPNNPLLPASQNEAMKTIRGDYLNPNTNPYFAQSVNDALGQAGSAYLGYYGGPAGTNMNNSGFQEGLARGLGAAATNAYNTNYQNERARQSTMAASAPQLVSQSNAAMFSPNQSFAGLIPGFTSTSVPYFNNPLGNTLSGALGGYALSKAA